MTEEDFKALIESLKVDLKLVEEMLREVSADIIREGFSAYPVFVATEHQVKLGELIVDKSDVAARFNIYATTLEELIDKKLVLAEKKDQFIKTFRNPQQYLCAMLLTAEIASFTFLPFTKGGAD